MDAFGAHVVVDRLSVVLGQFHEFVSKHALVEALDADDEVKVAVQAAEEALAQAYQAAGNAYL